MSTFAEEEHASIIRPLHLKLSIKCIPLAVCIGIERVQLCLFLFAHRRNHRSVRCPFFRVEFIVIVGEVNVDWVAVAGVERGRFLERLRSSTLAMFTSSKTLRGEGGLICSVFRCRPPRSGVLCAIVP